MKRKLLSLAAILLAAILIVEIGFLIKLKTADTQSPDTPGNSATDQAGDSGPSQESDVPKDTEGGDAQQNTEGDDSQQNAEGGDTQQNAEKPASTDGNEPDSEQPDTSTSTDNTENSGGEAVDSTTAPTETEGTRPGGLDEDELPPIPV